MAPNIQELEDLEAIQFEKLTAPQAGSRKYDIVYKNILKIGYLHILTLYGAYLCFTSAKWATVLFAYACYVAATIGVTAGAHRLWSHQSYKAKTPLQIILIIFLSMANQRATHWVRDHRLHHKHTDTDADPHNAARGFFYSHIGWLFVKKHPEVIRRGRTINLSDLFNNPVVRFQHRYAKYFTYFFAFILPTLIPMVFWGETLNIAWTLTIMRYVLNFHVFFLVNSAAHMWGNKPYDKNILSVDNSKISLATLGEGYHNFHHTFPWDYRSAELGNQSFNYTKAFIDLMAKVGWAYDLKTASLETVEKKAERSGDGSRKTYKAH